MIEASPSRRLLVFVCTYNERANLPRLVDEIRRSVPAAHLLVIDDGSPDGTGEWAAAEAAKQNGLSLIQRGAKLGLGTAIRAGLQYAIDEGYDDAVNLDGDFSHDPTQIPQLVEAAHAKRAALVIGSRYVPGGGLKNCSWRRHLVSRAANLYARAVVGWNIRDCSSAYRCYAIDRLRCIDLNKIECVGYGFLEEILWAILCSGGSVVETPIVYTEREHGDSKISLKEALGTIQVLHKLGLARLGRHSKRSSPSP